MKPKGNILEKVKYSFPYFYVITICLIYLVFEFPHRYPDNMLSVIFVTSIIMIFITQFFFQFKYVNQVLGVIILFCSIMVALAVYSDVVNMTTTWTWTIKRVLIVSFVVTNFYAAFRLLINREQTKLPWQQQKQESAWKTIRKFLLSFAKVDPKL